MSKGIYIGGLPSEYTRVEYLRSDGSCYIDTGFYPNQYSRMVVDVDFEGGVVNYNNICGAMDNTWRWFAIMARSSTYVFARYGSSAPYLSQSVIGRHTIDLNITRCYMDGALVATYNYQWFSVHCPIAIFTYSQYNDYTETVSFGKYGMIGKIFSFQIYDDDLAVRDFVPCKNSLGVLGMYDLINKVFYTNLGTGVFTSGPEVSPLSNGQIVKTYLGVNNIAHEVVRGYIGDENGIAKQFHLANVRYVWQKWNIANSLIYGKSDKWNYSSNTSGSLDTYSSISINADGTLKGTGSYQSIDLDGNVGNTYSNYSHYPYCHDMGDENEGNTLWIKVSSVTTDHRVKGTSIGVQRNKGTTRYTDVSADNPNAYPQNGIYEGYWYVYQGEA